MKDTIQNLTDVKHDNVGDGCDFLPQNINVKFTNC